jgi:hypothetical protein
MSRGTVYATIGIMLMAGQADAAQVITPPAAPITILNSQGRVAPFTQPPANGMVEVSNRPIAMGNNSMSGGVNTNTRGLVTVINTATDLAALQAGFSNFSINQAAKITNGGCPITVTAGVECPIGTIAGSMTFGGATAAVIAPGGAVFTDPFPVYVPAGQMAHVRFWMQVPSGCAFPRGWIPLYAVPFVERSEEAGTTAAPLSDNTVTLSGTANIYNGANGAAWGPFAIRGLPAVARPSAALVGDSLTWGQGDDATGLSVTPTGDGIGDYGPIQRGLWAAGIGMVKLAKSGVYARDLVAQSFNWKYGLGGATTCVVYLGTNDITNNATLAATQGYLQEIWNSCAALGKHVIGVTIPPRSSTSLGLAAVPTIASGGSLYPASSTFNVSLSGGTLDTVLGTPGTPAIVSVSTNASGVVTAVNSVTSIGYYTTQPSSPASTVTTGAGSGLTLTLTSFVGWLDSASQNPQGNTPAAVGQYGGPSSVRGQFNAWLRSRPSPVECIIDLGAAVEDGSNTGRWVAKGTNDGTHNNQVAIPLAQAAVAAAIGSGCIR